MYRIVTARRGRKGKDLFLDLLTRPMSVIHHKRLRLALQLKMSYFGVLGIAHSLCSVSVNKIVPCGIKVISNPTARRQWPGVCDDCVSV